MKKSSKQQILKTNDTNYYVLAAGLLVIIVSMVFYFYSDELATGMATTDSAMGNFTVNIGTNIDCIWSDDALTISFGDALNQGDTEINATLNYNSSVGENNRTHYNVTIGGTSNVAVNISIEGDDLQSQLVNIIGLGNVTWASNNTQYYDAESQNSTSMVYANSNPIEPSYDTTNYVATNISAGNITYYRFWIDIPSTTIGGDYTGNYSMQCSQY